MKRAAGIPFPETSAMKMPSRSCPMVITSKGITSKKSPPTSLAMTHCAAISKCAICGSVSGRKLRWISAAIASSVFFRSTSRSRPSRSAWTLRSFSRLWMNEREDEDPGGVGEDHRQGDRAHQRDRLLERLGECEDQEHVQPLHQDGKGDGNDGWGKSSLVCKPDQPAQESGEDRGEHTGHDGEPAQAGAVEGADQARPDPDHRAPDKPPDHRAQVADIDDRPHELDPAHRPVDRQSSEDCDQDELGSYRWDGRPAPRGRTSSGSGGRQPRR